MSSAQVETIKVADEVFALRHWMPTPMGVLAVTSFVVLGNEPMLIDTHAPICRDSFQDAAWKLVDPKDVKWVVITHDDQDHMGNFDHVIEKCGNAHWVAPLVCGARRGEVGPVPMPRLRIVNPGESWQANGRTFGILRPPAYDSPASIALFDSKNEILFASDSFGALIPKPVNEVGEVPAEDFGRGFGMFQSFNSPWTHLVQPNLMAQNLEKIRALNAKVVLSAHGPIARNRTNDLLAMVASAAAMPALEGPTHEQFLQMMAAMAGG